jgi:hypothetical protein
VFDPTIKRIIKSNWDIEHVQLSRDGNTLFWIVNEDAYSKLYKKSLKANEMEEISLEKEGVIEELDHRTIIHIKIFNLYLSQMHLIL